MQQRAIFNILLQEQIHVSLSKVTAPLSANFRLFLFHVTHRQLMLMAPITAPRQERTRRRAPAQPQQTWGSRPTRGPSLPRSPRPSPRAQGGHCARSWRLAGPVVTPAGGTAQHSTAWHGTALHSIAWHSMAWHGMAWHSMARHGIAHRHITRPGRLARALLVCARLCPRGSLGTSAARHPTRHGQDRQAEPPRSRGSRGFSRHQRDRLVWLKLASSATSREQQEAMQF